MMSKHRTFSDEVVRLNFKRLLRFTKTPFSDALGLLLVKGDDFGIATHAMPDPKVYSEASVFRRDYACAKFLSKWKGLRTGINTKTVALDTWRGAELRCRDTNRKLTHFRTVPGEYPADIRERISRAQQIILSIIGPSPNLAAIECEYKYSDGATLRTRRGASIDQKLSIPIAVTREALPLLARTLLGDAGWVKAVTGEYLCPLDCRHFFEVVDSSRTETVSKDAKTDRMISIEPAGNSFLQQGVHGILRNALARAGVDLSDQSINQGLAGIAHAFDLSTLDLKSASDTVCSELVFLLLPIEWALLLNSLRTKQTTIDGEAVRLHKFSSMGNAFTFELESLLFYALCKACSHKECDVVSVYGDDLIVCRENAGRVIELLEWCGFQLNLEKSYLDGDFFESCGSHYFKGVDVTPVYQKEEVNDLSEHIRLHNRMFRWLSRCETLSSRSLQLGLWRTAMETTNNIGRRCLLPEDAPDDRGFLTGNGWKEDWKYHSSLGLKTSAWVYSVKDRPGKDDFLLAYKLRRSDWSSVRPDGRAAVSRTRGAWREIHCHVHTAFELIGLPNS